jgi:hypothetical protein
MIARKTSNGNFLVFDKIIREYRFVTENGNHIRWVESDEADYLCKVIEPTEEYLILDNAKPPINETIWQHVTPPENPDLSNNGGSYAFLHRVERLEGWGGGVDGIRLVTNHLYGSDYEEQGWRIDDYFSNEGEAWEFIENFKVGVA